MLSLLGSRCRPNPFFLPTDTSLLLYVTLVSAKRNIAFNYNWTKLLPPDSGKKRVPRLCIAFPPVLTWPMRWSTFLQT